jgi:hypothetical protein
MDSETQRPEKVFFILLKECLAERKVKASLFSKSRDNEEMTALGGSLWYMKSSDFNSMSSGKTGHRAVFYSAEQSDISIIVDEFKDIVQLSLTEYQLLLAVTTCKERAAVYQANTLPAAIKLYQLWCTVKDKPHRVDVIDRKGLQEQLNGTLIYAGKINGLSGFWFAVEFPVSYSGDLTLTDGIFGGQQLFRCDSDRTVLVAVDKLRLNHSAVRPASTHNRPQLVIGDRILWISPSDSHELGTVRWIDLLPDACPSEHTVGVEFVSMVPDTYY